MVLKQTFLGKLSAFTNSTQTKQKQKTKKLLAQSLNLLNFILPHPYKHFNQIYLKINMHYWNLPNNPRNFSIMNGQVMQETRCQTIQTYPHKHYTQVHISLHTIFKRYSHTI